MLYNRFSLVICFIIVGCIYQSQSLDLLPFINDNFISPLCVSILFPRCAQSLSHVQLFGTPWTVTHQAPLSMEFFRQEYWSELSFPTPGDLPNPGISGDRLGKKGDKTPLEGWFIPVQSLRQPWSS